MKGMVFYLKEVLEVEWRYKTETSRNSIGTGCPKRDYPSLEIFKTRLDEVLCSLP